MPTNLNHRPAPSRLVSRITRVLAAAQIVLMILSVALTAVHLSSQFTPAAADALARYGDGAAINPLP